MRPSDEPVSVVIVARDALAFLPECLDSVSNEAGSSSEILVVDHASRDGTSAWLKERGVRTVAAPEGGGPARARNAGLAVARHDLVLLLDADARLVPGALGLLRERIGGSGAAVACPVVFAAGTGMIQHGPARLHIVGLSAFEGWWSEPAAPRPWRGKRYSSCGATALLVRRTRLSNQIFDESFGEALEDADFAFRVAARGGSVVCEPDARVIHDNPRLEAEAAGRCPDSRRKFRTQARNRRWLMLKAFDGRTLIATAPLQAAFECATALLALRCRAGRDYALGWVETLRGLPRVLRERAAFMPGKAVGDDELLAARGLSLRPSTLNSIPAAAPRALESLADRAWRGSP